VHDAIDVIVALIVDYYGNVRDHYGDGRRAHNCARGVGRLYIFYFHQLIDFQKRVFALLFDL
jgi:hypothetical protein